MLVLDGSYVSSDDTSFEVPDGGVQPYRDDMSDESAEDSDDYSSDAGHYDSPSIEDSDEDIPPHFYHSNDDGESEGDHDDEDDVDDEEAFNESFGTSSSYESDNYADGKHFFVVNFQTFPKKKCLFLSAEFESDDNSDESEQDSSCLEPVGDVEDEESSEDDQPSSLPSAPVLNYPVVDLVNSDNCKSHCLFFFNFDFFVFSRL